MARRKLPVSKNKTFNAVFDILCDLSDGLRRRCIDQIDKAAHTLSQEDLCELRKLFNEYAECLQALYHMDTVIENVGKKENGEANGEEIEEHTD